MSFLESFFFVFSAKIFFACLGSKVFRRLMRDSRI